MALSLNRMRKEPRALSLSSCSVSLGREHAIMKIRFRVAQHAQWQTPSYTRTPQPLWVQLSMLRHQWILGEGTALLACDESVEPGGQDSILQNERSLRLHEPAQSKVLQVRHVLAFCRTQQSPLWVEWTLAAFHASKWGPGVHATLSVCSANLPISTPPTAMHIEVIVTVGRWP